MHCNSNQARTQDFEKGGSEYRVAVRPRRGGGCGRSSTLWMIYNVKFSNIAMEKKLQKQ